MQLRIDPHLREKANIRQWFEYRAVQLPRQIDLARCEGVIAIKD